MIKIGVIGIGHLGNFHSNILKNSPGFELVGLCDADLQKLEEKTQEYACRAYKTYMDLLNDVDAISIATPTTLHYEHIKTALEMGKHVFVEKPVTTTVVQAREVVKLAEDKGLVLQVGHIERFNPAMLALKDLYLNPIFIESHRLATFQPRGTDVAVVLDLMIHDIDLILNLVKSPVKHIEAAGVGLLTQSEDISNCRLTFENGCVANVTASRISLKKMRKMRIFQPGAYLGLDFDKGAADVYYLPEDFAQSDLLNGKGLSFGNMDFLGSKKSLNYAHLEPQNINPLAEELEHFGSCIKSGRTPLVSGEDGLRALEVADEILHKINEHRNYTLKRMGIKNGAIE